MCTSIRKTLTTCAAGVAATLALSAGAMAEEKPVPSDSLVAQARSIVGQFSEKLKSQLVGAMKAEGPVKAIEVCKVAAPAIAGEVSTEGWSVGRTSLKLRNAKSKPNEWEKQTLELFEAEKAKGADVTKLERSEIADVNGVRTFRYMKAIPTAEPCLTCHGSEVKEPVKAKLAELYPNDRATGFKLGDIRGAFTLSKPVQ
ncbi:MAG: DUF3365 domain-containing protein [Rhodomicrobium sp.]